MRTRASNHIIYYYCVTLYIHACSWFAWYWRPAWLAWRIWKSRHISITAEMQHSIGIILLHLYEVDPSLTASTKLRKQVTKSPWIYGAVNGCKGWFEHIWHNARSNRFMPFQCYNTPKLRVLVASTWMRSCELTTRPKFSCEHSWVDEWSEVRNNGPTKAPLKPLYKYKF